MEKFNKTEKKVFIHQVKDRLGWCHNLKIFLQAQGKQAFQGNQASMHFKAQKKGIVKTLKRESESNTRMTRMGGKWNFGQMEPGLLIAMWVQIF